MLATTQHEEVIALIRGGVRHVFIYTAEHVPLLYAVFERYAADPECSFTWNDAWLLREKVRHLLAARATHPASPEAEGGCV